MINDDTKEVVISCATGLGTYKLMGLDYGILLPILASLLAPVIKDFFAGKDGFVKAVIIPYFKSKIKK